VVEAAKTIWKYRFVIPAVICSGRLRLVYQCGFMDTARSAYYSVLAQGFLKTLASSGTIKELLAHQPL
jgi:hypothetical protein